MSAVEFSQEDLERAAETDIYVGPGARWTPQLEAYRVARQYGLTHAELLSRRRTAKLVQARRVLYRALRARGWSYPKIAKFAGRDHTTILYALDADVRADKEDRRKARISGVRDGVQVRGLDERTAHLGVAHSEDLAQVPRGDLAGGDGDEQGAAGATIPTPLAICNPTIHR